MAGGSLANRQDAHQHRGARTRHPTARFLDVISPHEEGGQPS